MKRSIRPSMVDTEEPETKKIGGGEIIVSDGN